MRTWISNSDLKTFIQGVAGVAACGLMLGTVMHPTLNVGDKPGGPQMLLSGGGPRGAAEASDPGVGVYAGRTPEYVIGTDWARPPAYAETAPAADQGEQGDAVVFTSDEELRAAEVTRTTWRDEPREPPVYPSARGGAYYEANLPPAPPPPSDDGDLAADAG